MRPSRSGKNMRMRLVWREAIDFVSLARSTSHAKSDAVRRGVAFAVHFRLIKYRNVALM